MITADRMESVDRNAESLGVPRRVLMESSGNAIARAVRAVAGADDTVAIVCGRGNNGGDGFVAARFLSDLDVSVYLAGRGDAITTSIARENWDVLTAADIERTEWRDATAVEIDHADVIVDALVGTGVSGALREPVATAVRAINDHAAAVIAVDTPTGVDPDTGEAAGLAVEADQVVTFHDEKPGLSSLGVPVTVADIGIPPAAERFVGPGDLRSFDRDPDSHKGEAGRVLIVGGGPFAGAPALSALSSLRLGADLAIVATPSAVADAVQGYSPDLIVRDLPGDRLTPDHVARLLDLAAPADCLILGPGVGDHPESMRTVRELLSEVGGRCVVDADALQAVPEVETDATLLCTPHQGELESMGGPREADWRDRVTAVEEFAATVGHTILVKGRYDVISDGEETRVNRTGNPGMTVGGTGDVLAGACAAAFASGDRTPVQAGAIGAYVTGAAGDRAAERLGHGLMATDVSDELPRVLWGDTDD